MKYTLFTILIIVLFACQSHDKPNVKEKPHSKRKKTELVSYNGYPVSPKNLSLVNSEYDDYNSAKQGEYERSTFLFSSNRHSKGKDFSIVQYNALTFDYSYSTGQMRVSTDNEPAIMSKDIRKMLRKINTSKNEYGPYILKLDHSFEFLLFYTQEDSEKLGLKFMAYKLDSIRKKYTHYLSNYGPYTVDLLNDKRHSVSYICIQKNAIYYCSDQPGNFDIYSYPIVKPLKTAKQHMDFLTTKTGQKPQALRVINSRSDDKCPFISNDFMVFASNRKGGYGGYDLWYSRLVGDEWTEPINFGPKINSKHDEFRPILTLNRGIPNDLMIFSSNRPGGKGGFDLYYVGIEQTRN